MYAERRALQRDDSSSPGRRAAEGGSELGGRLAIRGEEERLPRTQPPWRPIPAPHPRRTTGRSSRPAGGAEQQKLVATRMAREFRLDPRLVFALIRVESATPSPGR